MSDKVPLTKAELTKWLQVTANSWTYWQPPPGNWYAKPPPHSAGAFAETQFQRDKWRKRGRLPATAMLVNQSLRDWAEGKSPSSIKLRLINPATQKELGWLGCHLCRIGEVKLQLTLDEDGCTTLCTETVKNDARVLVVGSFYSNFEHTMKGIGSTLLKGLLELAEGGDCDHIVIAGSINDEVYEAFGFKALGDSCFYMSTQKLRKRLARGLMPLPGCRVAPAEAPW
jgi:hypothetical protein